VTNTGKNVLFTQEYKDKMSIAIRGKKHTQETKRKMSIARMGKKRTQATKDKMSAAQLARYAKAAVNVNKK